LALDVNSDRLVAIVGPTASGKSALALEAARRFNGEIVSCDSVQVYRGLDVGSGKPSQEARRLAPHHLVDILDLGADMNAAVFAERAAGAIRDIAGRGHLPIVAGGTGLYLTALLKGLFPGGGTDGSVRDRLRVLMEEHGPARLHRLLAIRDPAYAAKTKTSDGVRIVRALEVSFVLGRPFSRVQQERQPAFSGSTLIIGIELSRQELRQRVVARVEGMLADGLIEETRRALAQVPPGARPPRSLGSIGYREVTARLCQGPVPPQGDDELHRAIVTSTMQYAKRQMTYFRHQFQVEWFADRTAALARVENWVGQEPLLRRVPIPHAGAGGSR
jgi:tRNA dimethylallyltransferase